jgi:hypothetical protein
MSKFIEGRLGADRYQWWPLSTIKCAHDTSGDDVHLVVEI